MWNRKEFGITKGLTIGLLGLALVAGTGTVLYYEEGIPRHAPPTPPRPPAQRLSRARAQGPLQVHPSNPRYFTDASGRAILLAGSHTWSNFQDNGFTDPPPAFDYESYLDFLVANNHNFLRLWCWEESRWAPWVATNDYYFYPGPPYERTGPGNALDGKPRFSLDVLDARYFERLRSRISQAAGRGIYVSVMLFNGWAIDDKHDRLHRGNPWQGHPFNRYNNVNGVDGDPNGDDGGVETHQLLIPRVTAYQERYVRRVVDAVNEFDNVLFEISNESYATSRDWQYHMIDLIHAYESTKPKQHPVGMSQYQWPGRNADLVQSPADWIAPWEELPEYPYRDDPREADGEKVVIVDTDHLWGIGGDRKWAWKSFMRGNQPSFMDAYDGASSGCGAPASWDVRFASWKEILKDLLHMSPRPRGWTPDAEQWMSLRANIGYILDFSHRIDLSQMVPRSALASSRYCLAHVSEASAEYLIYIEDPRKPFHVDLSGFSAPLRQEWFDPSTAKTVTGPIVTAGGIRRLQSPFASDAVLYLHSMDPQAPEAQGDLPPIDSSTIFLTDRCDVVAENR